ncbi:MAG: methylenetetrahydrofolate reductase [Rhodobacteraceae bacterium]|nr:methylenetetrahydrofolate reductase [Paracoccaceae bacterium]
MTGFNAGSTLAASAALLRDFSIEVMPRTADRIADFGEILSPGTRIYIAHIEGTPFADMLRTAKRLSGAGYRVIPHFTARAIHDRGELEAMIKRYRDEADVHRALVLAGGMERPVGQFDSSMRLLRTGLFDAAGFTELHVAGHPEGNRDIDPGGGFARTDHALREKQEYSENSDASMALVTQFAFDAAPVTAWAERISAAGITLPIHVGIAGPAKLQTLIKFALACGVGSSLRVLQRRASDLSKLLVPFEPTGIVHGLAETKAKLPDSRISNLHVFPLGGIAVAAKWIRDHPAYRPPD